MNGMATVLVVDDEANVRLTLAMALRRLGHEVAIAPDAEAALDVLHERSFEWVVSDVRMPGMSGVELAALLGNSCDAPRVVLTSAYSDVTAPCTVVAFFQKPVDTRQLSDFLNRPPQTREEDCPPPAGAPTGGAVVVAEVPVERVSTAANLNSVMPPHLSWASRAEVSQAVKQAMDFVAARRAQCSVSGGQSSAECKPL